MTLEVTSREFNAPDEWQLFNHLPAQPLVFSRDGEGIVGFGEALRLTARGEDRINSLARQWRSLGANAVIDDAVQTSGSGLVAFGSFAFADESEFESVLVIPEILVGRRDGRAWFTRILHLGAEANDVGHNQVGAKESAEPELPNFAREPQSYPTAAKLNFEAGQMDADGFMTAVADAVAHIRKHDIDKVVLARDIAAELPEDFDLRATLKRLSTRFSSCWTYSVDGTFGASPELLVRVANGQVSARVLAGTAGRGTDPSIDIAISQALSASAKNRSEHAYAVDSLVRSLTPYCTAIETDAEPFSLALPNLWHLASDVQGVLRESASSIDLAAALHPTAAVAGTPTNLAQAMIAELEPFDRGRYAGPVGWIGADGDGEWAIALRGAQISGSTVMAYAGCGIVAESNPAAELAETELKFAPIRNAFA
ncbi:MAG: isochorismate synthase MenF [Micrococcales bacterium]